MTDASQPLANSRHERFAQSVASGMAAAAAYVEAGYTDRGANAHASRLIANGSVAARIAWLKSQTARAASRSREDVVERLLRIGMGEAVESHETSLGGEAIAIEAPAKTADQIKALALAAKLCGWERAPEPSDKPTEHNLNVNVAIADAIAGARKT